MLQGASGSIKQTQHVRLIPFSVFTACQRRRSRGGGGTQRLNVHEFKTFSLKRGIFTLLRVYTVDFLERPAQSLRLQGAGARVFAYFFKLGSSSSVTVIGGAVLPQQTCEGLARIRVEGVPLSGSRFEAQLVGLSVHSNKGVPNICKGPDRGRAPTNVGTGTPRSVHGAR